MRRAAPGRPPGAISAAPVHPGLTQVDLADPPPLHGLGLAASRNHPPSEAGRALRRALLAAH